MSWSVQGSWSGGRRSPTRGDTLLARYLPPYGAISYIRNVSSCFDTRTLSILARAGYELSIPLEPGVRNTAAGAWLRYCKPWRGRGHGT